ncbi:MAG: GGDEF domain-containing protein [Lachnospiraceae bacterium]|nr:GGDEF domain-containing protein [Lachnospiraceae bacterium]
MRIEVIAADLVCIGVLLIILTGTLLIKSNRNSSTGLFCLNIIMTVLGLSADGYTYYVDGKVQNLFMLGFITLLAYVIVDFLLIIFSFYMVAVIREWKEVSTRVVVIPIIFAVIDIIRNCIGAVNGKLFYFVDYCFYTGPWDDYAGVLPLLSILGLYFVLVKNHKALGKKRSVAFLLYMFLPVLSGVFQLFIEGFDYSYVLVTFSLIIIYVVIQAQVIAEGEIRSKILREASYVDALTGLGNRRVYNKIIDEKKDVDTVAVAFCDLNSLKYVNDNQGHEMGDKYIINFANLLNTYFPDGDVCRISGDEFVVFLYNLTEEDFEKRMDAFKIVINENNRIASMGYTYGTTANNILKLVGDAEIKMYKDKEKYYLETGRDRRR